MKPETENGKPAALDSPSHLCIGERFPFMSEILTGKVAFISGGSRGMGSVTALNTLAQELGSTLSQEQVADVVNHPCLPGAAMITGHTFFVDGGYAISE